MGLSDATPPFDAQVGVKPLNPMPDLDDMLRGSPTDFKDMQASSAFRSVGVDCPGAGDFSLAR